MSPTDPIEPVAKALFVPNLQKSIPRDDHAPSPPRQYTRRSSRVTDGRPVSQTSEFSKPRHNRTRTHRTKGIGKSRRSQNGEPVHPPEFRGHESGSSAVSAISEKTLPTGAGVRTSFPSSSDLSRSVKGLTVGLAPPRPQTRHSGRDTKVVASPRWPIVSVR